LFSTLKRSLICLCCAMALTLQGLSRAACRQQLLAASPKVLRAFTPKTPAFSPSVGGAARFSPFSTAAVSFGDLETATPKALETMTGSAFGGALWQRTSSGGASPACCLRQAKASAAAQQELAMAARQSAEAALRHFLARRRQAWPETVAMGNAQAVLEGQGPRTLLRRCPSTATLPTLLGRSKVDAPSQPPTERAPEFEFDAVAAAHHAREAFLARQQRIGSRGIDQRVP